MNCYGLYYNLEKYYSKEIHNTIIRSYRQFKYVTVYRKFISLLKTFLIYKKKEPFFNIPSFNR